MNDLQSLLDLRTYLAGVRSSGKRIGFVPTAAVVIFASARALGARLRLALPLAMLAPIVVHLLFYKLLRVPLPAGYLPMPW